MDTLSTIFDWLESREGVLSAIAALAAIIGISYAILAFIFPSLGRLVKQKLGHEDATPLAPTSSSVTAVPDGPPLDISRSSIAVLPLRALSSNEDDQNMAAGLSAEINADLAQVPDLRVASHLATFAFRGDNVNLREVADVLRIHYVVTGTFQRSGDRIRLMVELTDAHSNEQLWASAYERELKDLFAVQAEVSQAIVGAIGGELKLADTRYAFEAPTQQLDAWGLVQKAYNFWLTRYTLEDYDKSVNLLRKAVELDPKYAGARASLAMILSQRALDRLSQDYEKDVNEALEMIEEAVRLAPNDLTVLESAGLVWTHRGYGLRARKALRDAVKFSPLDLIAWGYLGFNLALTGSDERTQEALDILDRLLKTAPKHPSTPYWNFFRAVALVSQGKLEDGEASAQAVLTAQPFFYASWLVLANIYGRRGEYDEARVAAQKAQEINPFLTPQLSAVNTLTLCMSEEQAEPFLCGLRSAGLIE